MIVGHVGSATEPLSPQSTIPLGLHVEGSSGVCCSVMRCKFSCWCPSGLACGGAAVRKADFSEAVKAWAANSRLPEIEFSRIVIIQTGGNSFMTRRGLFLWRGHSLAPRFVCQSCGQHQPATELLCVLTSRGCWWGSQGQAAPLRP